MRLPSVALPITDWGSQDLERWGVLEIEAAKMSEAAGSNDAFDRAVAVLRDMASTGRFGNLLVLLKRRLTARALTWLWLNDEHFTSKMLNPSLLNTLIKAQEPRLTRMTLQQLAQLYFRRFDELDKQSGIRELLEQRLLQQLEKMPPAKIETSWADPLVTLQREGHWLLSLDGPAKLAKRVRDEGRELGETFTRLGLQGFDDGRYGDVCRAHFYLEILRSLPLGASDPVLDELLKPSVSKAPYEGSRRIGHVALEILIDRVTQDPSDIWQEFIINLAGDPRIASSALNYREWWQPLGEKRIEKVRGWLSKEDLRLFLSALEQYGFESQNDELQRMFPARKTFLEGLFKLKLIRSSRLLLGSRASQAVKRILGKDVKTSFASMDGQMSDKAVIYLDCGDFHLVEGSHSFKIWVYLAAPSSSLRTYEKNKFSHSDLTRMVPSEYKKTYPGLPFDSFVHSPNTWQNNVFNFLANNGIALDIEQLLSPKDYQYELRRFGLPVVKRNVKLNRTPVVHEHPANINIVNTSSVEKDKPRAAITNTLGKQSLGLAGEEKKQPNPFAKGPRPARHIIRIPRSPKELGKPTVSSLPMATSASQAKHGLDGNELAGLAVDLADEGQNQDVHASAARKSMPRISRLTSFELNVLRYFYDNPGDKARYAAEVLGIDRSEVNRVLYSTLKSLCRQGKEHGWKLTESARSELEIFDQQW